MAELAIRTQIRDRRPRWTNWARNQVCAPLQIHHPASEAKLVEIVRRAAEQDERVKVVGSGHSFTGTALTDGHLVELDRYQRVLHVDAARHQATVQAGIRLRALSEQLWAHGLSMPNMGDIAYQSISGAVSTGTHGTGTRFGSLATQVVGLRLITGAGDVIDCSAEQHPEVFAAARVGLGALGIISTVTLQLAAAFNLHALEQVLNVDGVMRDLDWHADENEHFEFFWARGSDGAFTKRNNRTGAPAQPLPRWQRFRNDVLIANVARNGLFTLDRVAPPLARTLRKRLPSTTREDYVDRSFEVFTSARKVRFYEMEYFIPRHHAREAFERVRDVILHSGIDVRMPVELRFVAADDIPLSPAFGRETVSIAVHMLRTQEFQPFFEAVETIMLDYDGRPHWGKLHFQSAAELAPRYPRWDAFQQVRAQLDPTGRFTNRYLDRVLGALPER
jgi:L-gulono-1,4-lactone dehydrogenase